MTKRKFKSLEESPFNLPLFKHLRLLLYGKHDLNKIRDYCMMKDSKILEKQKIIMAALRTVLIPGIRKKAIRYSFNFICSVRNK